MDSRPYKAIVTILILSFSYLTALGQKERHTTLEHNVFLGAGLFAEGGNMGINQFPGISVRLSYGADIRFDRNWSVMPGASLTACKGAILRMWPKGGDGDGFLSADLFCQARWGFKISEGTRFVVGVGPEASYMLVPVKYTSESPSPYAGKDKVYRFNAGIKPGIMLVHGDHWQWGFEASIGLLNNMIQYSDYGLSGTIRLNSILLVAGYKF